MNYFPIIILPELSFSSAFLENIRNSLFPITFMVDSGYIHAIIGAKGSKIRQLIEETGTEVCNLMLLLFILR